jgi:hypothetical protein
MIQRAIERGVSKEKIAAALGLGVQTIRQRTRLLEGICPDAVALLQDAACPAGVFHLLRRMASLRQVEAAELMVGQGNFTTVFAKAILAATPDAMLVDPRKRPGVDRRVSRLCPLAWCMSAGPRRGLEADQAATAGSLMVSVSVTLARVSRLM